MWHSSGVDDVPDTRDFVRRAELLDSRACCYLAGPSFLQSISSENTLTQNGQMQPPKCTS